MACTPAQINETIKTQTIRVLDVFLIGPLMVAGGIALGRRGNPFWGILLGVSGVATVAYNGRNYLRVRRAQQSAGELTHDHHSQPPQAE